MRNKMVQKLRTVRRIGAGGLVASGVWYAGLLFVFGSAQSFLANPAYQSQKFLDVFTRIEPLPRMVVQPVAFYVGLLIVGMSFSFAWYLIGHWMTGRSLKKGIVFGCIAWLLMVPWFEFYLPWNVMHEPIMLVLLEMILWFVVLMLVSISTVYTHDFFKSENL